MSVTIISFSLLSSPPEEMLEALVPKMHFHEEVQLPLLTFLRLTRFQHIFFKYNNRKQPYETPGNILIFIFFELKKN